MKLVPGNADHQDVRVVCIRCSKFFRRDDNMSTVSRLLRAVGAVSVWYFGLWLLLGLLSGGCAMQGHAPMSSDASPAEGALGDVYDGAPPYSLVDDGTAPYDGIEAP